jgi:basic membrane lipoprotein Med (substrate-binding protein (PBP1-ABC) superfamily)
MVGFIEGVKYYNTIITDSSKKIKFAQLGKEEITKTGFKSGDGKAMADKLLLAKADVILPVAGPQTADVISAIDNAKSKC